MISWSQVLPGQLSGCIDCVIATTADELPRLWVKCGHVTDSQCYLTSKYVVRLNSTYYLKQLPMQLDMWKLLILNTVHWTLGL